MDRLPNHPGWTAHTRRRFLQGTAAALAGVTLGRSASYAGEAPAVLPPNGQAKNIIFCVSDGMSAGVMSLAEEFSKARRDRGTTWIALQNAPGSVGGMMETFSLNSLVTDSAAASSAWGSGHRVNNGAINILPDGQQLPTLAGLFRQAGKKVGLVTTATATHATPAGFAANVETRQNQDEIARQYLDRVDVVLGGGAKYFSAETRTDGADLWPEYAQAGFVVCRSGSELVEKTAPGAKVLGIFAEDHLPYTIDQLTRKEVQTSVPTLAEMSRAALTALAGQGTGFLLQIEGARIDHAAHQNDIATLLWEQLAFDDAVRVAWDFAQKNPDTLLIVTTDHGNSNPGLNGMGGSYGQSTECFTRVGRMRESFESLGKWAQKQAEGGRLNVASWTEMMETVTGLKPSSAEAEILCAAVQEKPVGNWNMQLANYWGLMGQITGNHTGIGWTGTTHTADPVILTASGPGAEEFSGYLKNYEIFGKLCALAKVKSA